MWSWYTEAQPVWPSVTAEFHSAHPNIQVVPRTFSFAEYSPAIEAAVAAGNAPDIFAPGTLAISYGRAGLLLDLKSALGTSFIKDFFPSTNREYSDGDKQYGIGWEAQMFGLFYNPEILKKANVDFPETWDDLISASAQIRSKTGLTPVAQNGNPSNNVVSIRKSGDGARLWSFSDAEIALAGGGLAQANAVVTATGVTGLELPAA
jgi:ABC-type glycerol-3-phosphate transport system substrate-binding protein